MKPGEEAVVFAEISTADLAAAYRQVLERHEAKARCGNCGWRAPIPGTVTVCQFGHHRVEPA